MAGSLRDPRGDYFLPQTCLDSPFSSLRSYHDVPTRVRRPSLLERFGDFTDSAPRSHVRDRRQMPIYSPSYTNLAPLPNSGKLTTELINTIEKNQKGIQLKGFSDAVYVNDLIWTLGWNRKALGKKYAVLLNLQSPKYNVVGVKQKTADENAYIPSIMLLHKEQIFYARVGGKEILSFNTHSHSFNLSYSNHNLSIAAMCCDKNYLYVIDQKHKERIKVLDYTFSHTMDIPTGMGETEPCLLDICVVPENGSATGNMTFVISKTVPYGFVRAVDVTGQLLWQIDCCTNPEFGQWFSPYSVSCTSTGRIFMLDRDSDKVYSISCDGNVIQELLTGRDGITKATRVSVHKRGDRLLIVNKDGGEIHNYQVKVESILRSGSSSSIEVYRGRKLSPDYSGSSLSSLQNAGSFLRTQSSNSIEIPRGQKISSDYTCSSLGSRYGSSLVIRELNSWDENSAGESSSGFYSSLSLPKTSSRNQDTLPNKVLSKLARSIAAQKMNQIALEHLDFDFEQLETLEAVCRTDMWKYNMRILTEWKNRRPENSRMKLASILHQAAEDGLVNYAVVRDILGAT